MDLKKLEALARKVGPEEWDADPLPESVDPLHDWWGVGIAGDEMGFVAQVPSWEQDKARYIAAADPATILALLDENARLRTAMPHLVSMDAPPPESSTRTGPPEDYDG